MSLMSDIWITQQCASGHAAMIEPFCGDLVKTDEQGQRIISYGLSSYGYDARLAEELKLFTNINSALIDPYNLNQDCYVDAKIQTDENGHPYAILPPNSFMLGRTVEYFRIPRDVAVVCLGKSTWARSGVTVVVTPLEPEWEGNVVIEIANLTSLPVKIYTGVGICQFLFLQGDQPCHVSYKDRGGKYDKQTGITLPKV